MTPAQHQRSSSQRSSEKPMISPMPVFQNQDVRSASRCSQGGSRSPHCFSTSTASGSTSNGLPMARASSRSISTSPGIQPYPEPGIQGFCSYR